MRMEVYTLSHTHTLMLSSPTTALHCWLLSNYTGAAVGLVLSLRALHQLLLRMRWILHAWLVHIRDKMQTLLCGPVFHLKEAKSMQLCKITHPEKHFLWQCQWTVFLPVILNPWTFLTTCNNLMTYTVKIIKKCLGRMHLFNRIMLPMLNFYYHLFCGELKLLLTHVEFCRVKQGCVS